MCWSLNLCTAGAAGDVMHYEDALDKFSLDVPSGEHMQSAGCAKQLRTAEASHLILYGRGTLAFCS